MKKLKSAVDLDEVRQRLSSQLDPKKPSISLSGGTCGRALGCEEVAEAFRSELEDQGLSKKIHFRMTGCQGFCEREPLVVIYPEKIFYQRVTPADVPEIVSQTVAKGQIIDRLLYADPITGKKARYEHEVPFYQRQQRLVFGSNGLLDPTSIDDYIALGGYSALSKALFGMKPEEVIGEITKSGLRGRGGAGFPTGRKWEICRSAPCADGDRYIICNADEGDPGAYMDRSLLEGNPHIVMEGMVIGAHAIGSHQGYVYVRNEYPLAVQNLELALEEARGCGLLGKDILGSGFDFDLRIVRGAGAFVCGEETALIASVEGRIGEPRPRPPYPAVSGLWGKPTNINNVETWANVPLILNNGSGWYSKIGTQTSKGTKIFSLVGKVNNTGLVEVPMGIKLREIVYDIGGGIRGGKRFKAVQTGGPSGGCIPEQLLDLAVDYESLTRAGAIMGSGGMIVMDENTCMVDVARYFMNFLKEESCGKCTPCREGIDRALEILQRICRGEGEEKDIQTLEAIGAMMKGFALCALGTTAPNPILSTIKYFRGEYEAHIRDRRCPAAVCRDLVHFRILPDQCTGCMACAAVCPSKAIRGEKKQAHTVDDALCTKCGLCLEACKHDAIVKE